MVNFLNLPTVQAPRNALVDLSPIGNAIDGNRRNALMVQENARQQEELAMRKSQFEYQQTRDKKQDARQDEKFFADRAQAVMNLPATDPRRAAVWQKTLEGHPGRASLTPDYLDPIKGPEMVLAEYGALRDPREDKMKDLEIRKTEAEITRLQRDPASSNDPAIVQTYKFRQALPEDQRKEFDRVQRAQQLIDAGTHYVNARTNEIIPKNLVDAEAQKELGTAIGKQAAAATGDLSASETALEMVDSIRNDPNRAAGTSIVSPIGNVIPKTPGYAFQKKVDQAKAGAFLTAIQQMRGMGALSNAEGDTATKAVTRMETSTNDSDFEKALEDYEKVIQRGQRQAQKMMKERERLQQKPQVLDIGDGFIVESE